MIWIIYALLSVVFFTLLNLLQRKIALNSKYQKASAVSFNLIAAGFAILIFLTLQDYKRFVLPTNYIAYIYMLISCLAYGFFEKLRFRVSKYLEASSNTVLSAFSSVIALSISVILIGEKFTIAKALGAFLILLAIVLLSDFKTIKINKIGIFLGIISYTFLGIGWGVDKIGTQYFKPEIYNIFIWVLPIIVIYLPKTNFNEIKYEIVNNKITLPIMAFLNVVGYILQLKALSMADAFKVIPVVQTSIILTVLSGIIFLKESENLKIKLIAAASGFIGVIVLSIY